ncbi:MAG: ABC transporter permease, partial [Culicoidibacterales bacterium]
NTGLGVFWAFFKPFLTIAIFWFVFSVGLKSAPVEGVPFILWLIAGNIPWFYLGDVYVDGAMSIRGQQHLVKKIVFPTELLPTIKVFKGLYTHLFLIGIMCIFFVLYGYQPTIYWLQIIYYVFASIMFMIALSKVTSVLVVVSADIGQLIMSLSQFLFWLTPIIWNIQIVSNSTLQFILGLNPFAYIVQGFRNSLIYQTSIFADMGHFFAFWAICAALWLLGNRLMKKFQADFSDMI